MKRSAIDRMYASVSTPIRRALTLGVLVGINLLIVMLTAGCTSGRAIAEEKPVLLVARKIVINYGCSSCHTIGVFPEAKGIFGPDLTHIGSDADNVILTQEYKDSGGKATTGKDYIRESILHPAVYVATDCPRGTCPTGLMPLNFEQQFAAHPEDLNLLIDLLYSLK